MSEERQYVPHYVQIKRYLRTLVAQKQPHDSMPSEMALASQFEVSRGTVKQAVMDLVNEGIIYRRQGSGTFVSEPRITRSFDRLPSFTEDIRRMGKGPDTRILSLKQVTVPPSLMELFDLREDELVTKFKRVVSTEGTPVVVVTSYLNPHIYPELRSDDIHESLYEALKARYGFIPTSARDTYSIVDVAPQTAALLKCRKNASVFFSQRIAYLDDGRVAEYVESFIRSDRFKFNIFIGMNSETGDSTAAEIIHSDIQFKNEII